MRLRIYLIFLLCLCSSLVSWATDQNDALNLVVGSFRKSGHVNPFIQKTFGDNTDFTHTKTFDGQATTLDLQVSAIEGARHIIADARTFKADKPINRIFMELFPSVDLSPEEIAQVKIIRCMPDALQNLAPQMKSGGKLEIEHIPHITMMGFEECWSLESGILKLNPFTGLFFPFFMEAIGYLPLQQRPDLSLNEKTKFWKNIMDMAKDKYARELASEGPTRYVKVLHAIRSLEKLLNPICPTGQSVQTILNAEYLEYASNPPKFMSEKFANSLSAFVACEMTMLAQQKEMTTYLEQLGCCDVTIQRKDNPYNGRRNVWIISATKK